jgi:integrase
MMDQIDHGLSSKSLNITFGEFMDEWLAASKSNLSPGTYSQYNQIARDYLKPELHRMLLRELRADQVQALYNRLQTVCGVPLIEKIHLVLHSSLEYARRFGYVTTNVADLVIVPSSTKREMQILNESQVSALLLASRDTHFETLIYLAVHTGMRQMELLGLKWTDIDWSMKTLKVQRQLRRKHQNEEWGYAELKTKASRRTIDLGNHAIEMLRARDKQQQLERHIAGQWQEFGLVFTTGAGTPFIQRNVDRDFKILLERAGIDTSFPFHDLRHTASSLMLNHGIPVIVVSRRLGHARPSITMDIYGHLIHEMQVQAANLMDELISPVEIEFTHKSLTNRTPEENQQKTPGQI